VNSTSCCPNTKYCIVDSDYKAKCCDIGSECGNPCASSLYQCPSTTTVSGKPTVIPACCSRGCPQVSAFKCAASLGGGCCSYGSTCGSGGECKATAPSTTSSAIVSIIPSGCTTSQIACPTSIGGGCCDNGFSCTVVDNKNYCASASASAVRTGPDGVIATAESENKGLSTGAKAGIGVGIGIGACLVLALLLWFCVIHRRLSKMESQRTASASVPAMSQGSGSAISKGQPLVPGRQPSDYFGPTAAPGPFTEDVTSPGTSPGVNRGVPATPQSPGDIQVPVEIDSRNHSNVTSPGNFEFNVTPPNNFEDLKQAKSSEYPVELP
jgi:hypothetical protein